MGHRPHPVVHLELHTGDREGASAFYADLLRWRTERIDAGCASYHALGLGGAFGGGIVQCPTRRPVWLPYVEVDRVDEVTDRRRPARRLRAARAARGPGGVAQRGGDARGRRDRVLAAQGPAQRMGRGVTERELLDAARHGDEDAFARLVEPHRGLLDAHCYRMLGSVDDAEDAVQDALLRAWRGLARFEGRSSLRTWLYTIATNACLKAIERRPKLVLPIDYGPATDPHEGTAPPLVESVWIEPYPDERLGLAEALAGPEARYEQRESVELAFIAALQHLPARQRAVLILRDVLGFSGAEAADALETTPEAVYSALQRAHKSVDARLPERSQQATLRALGDDALREIVDAFVAAWERGDVDAVAAMLAQEAIIAMPPMPTWYHGRDAVEGFLRRSPLRPGLRWRVVPARANGQLAFGFYLWSDETRTFAAHDIIVLTMDGARIAELVAFLDPEAFRHFELPPEWGDPA